jgi:DNA polymerase IV
MNLPSPRDNQYLFLDMNAYFASCEQHRHPELRGKPVAVTPTLHDSGCVTAASYEAKRLGVTTGCRVAEARKRIPNITVLKADPKYYVIIHNQIATFLTTEITPSPLRLSIDEFAIPLTPSEQWTPTAHNLALFLQHRLTQVFSPHLRCSIGIGPNPFLAKLGTEIQKPNGLVLIQLHTLRDAYRTLKLRDIPGINWGMSYRLNSIGIQTPVQFFDAPQEVLHSKLGIMGDAWWYNLHGYTVSHKETPTKSISHSHVLAPRLRTKIKARAVLYKLWIKVAERLREKGLAAGSVAIAARGSGIRWNHIFTVRPTQNVFALFRAIALAYDTELSASFSPIKITVVAYNLKPYQPTWLGLFPEDHVKFDNLYHSIDAINKHYGRWTIQPASTLTIGDSAPNRIAFHAPDYDMDE